MKFRLPVLVLLLLISGALFSCKSPTVSHYKIPKEMRIKSAEELNQVRDLDIAWELPSGWVPGGQGQFRVASFRFSNQSSNDDITVTRFPGQTGGFLRNINRWRGQVGLDPIANTDDLIQVPILGDLPSQAYRVEIVGDKESILALIVSVNNWTYFIKYQDKDSRFKTNKESVLSFMSTVNTMGISSNK